MKVGLMVGSSFDGEAARRAGFAHSCRPEHGRLLHALAGAAPYDLLVLDGGGQGKAGTAPATPGVLLRPGGTLVVDDLTPARHRPARYEGAVDEARQHWLRHPDLDAAELRIAPDLAALVATRRFPET